MSDLVNEKGCTALCFHHSYLNGNMKTTLQFLFIQFPFSSAPADWKHSYYLKLKDFYKESALVLMSEKVCDAAMHQRKAKR